MFGGSERQRSHKVTSWWPQVPLGKEMDVSLTTTKNPDELGSGFFWGGGVSSPVPGWPTP